MNEQNTGTTYDIVCPYCFKRYSCFRTLFIDYKNYAEEIYPEYADYLRHYLGMDNFAVQKMPLYFSRSGNDMQSDPFTAITVSGDRTHARACPHCYNVLPAAAGKEKSFSVVIVGADDAQRSYYIASLLHELNKRMLGSFGTSFIPADYRTAQVFCEQYEAPLYVDGTVPLAPGTVTPLIFDLSRHGASGTETWRGSKVTFDRALVYIYNISRELCDRYPMIASNAIAGASGLILIFDAAEMTAGTEPVTDPWIGHLTETVRKIFGTMSLDRPAAVVLAGADKAELPGKKWSAAVKASASKQYDKVFPAAFFEKQSAKIRDILGSCLPAYYSAIEALFPDQTTMFFTDRSWFDTGTDAPAAFNPADRSAFLWILSQLGMIYDERSVKLF